MVSLECCESSSSSYKTLIIKDNDHDYNMMKHLPHGHYSQTPNSKSHSQSSLQLFHSLADQVANQENLFGRSAHPSHVQHYQYLHYPVLNKVFVLQTYLRLLS